MFGSIFMGLILQIVMRILFVLKLINKLGYTYLEKRKGLLCLGPVTAVGVKDARLLQ